MMATNPAKGAPMHYTPALAAPVSARAKLTNVLAVHVEAKHLGGFAEEALSSLGFTATAEVARWLVDGERILVFFPFTVKIEWVREDDERTPLALLKVAMRADYEFDSREPLPDDAELASFVAIAAHMHVWPYIRAEVQSLSSKIGFPSLVLPVKTAMDAASSVVVEKHLAEDSPKPTTKVARRARKATQADDSGAAAPQKSRAGASGRGGKVAKR
jgi:hypothetical protein